jgi:hypothetical protein
MTTLNRTIEDEDNPYPRAQSPTDIPVSVAMVYAAWGHAMLEGDPLLAEQLETPLLLAGNAASAGSVIDTAIATAREARFPFERSTLDVAVAKLVASASVAAEFRLYSLRGMDIAGYLLHRRERAEYIGTRRQHQVRHTRCTEILPPRTAASAGHALARGNPADYSLFTDFDSPTQLRFSAGPACSRYKPFDHPLLHSSYLSLFGLGAIPALVDNRVPVTLKKGAGCAQSLSCLHEADLLRLHAGLTDARWVHLGTTSYSLLAPLPNLEVDAHRQPARFYPRRALRELTGLADCHFVNLPRLLALELVWRHRWFAPARVDHWVMLAREAGERVASEVQELEGWLIS